MADNCSDRIVLVTGATRGIGESIAQVFQEAGATVLLHGRNRDRLEAVRQKLGLPASSTFVADLRSVTEIEALFAAIAANYPGLDILINNAGVSLSGSFLQHSAEELRELLDINVRAVHLCCRQALPLMQARGGGAIVNLSSNAASKPLPFLAAYSASKAALEALSSSLREELAPYHIKVMAIAPGAVETEMSTQTDPEFARQCNQDIIRLQPSAVAKAILALCQFAQIGNPKMLIFEHDALAASPNHSSTPVSTPQKGYPEG
ncbi:MAG: SDR family oxidoreductase [Actinomycetota bacterium]